MRRLVPIALLVLLVVSVVPMPSASLEVSEEMEVDTNHRDVIQRVDGDDDGNYHVIYYSDEPDSNDLDLMYKKLSPSGEVMVDSLKLTPSNMDGPGGNTALAVDDTGRAHVAMVLRTDNMDYYGILYAQVGSDGRISVSAKKVYEDGDGTRPSGIDMEVDAAGNAYIVWHQITDPPTIMWAKVSPAGAVSKEAKEISGDLQFGGTVAYPRLGVANNGDNLIVWQQKTNQFSRTAIWFTRLASSGTVDVDPVEAISDTLNDLEYLEATAHRTDAELHVVYLEGTDAQYRRVDDEGVVRGSRTIYSDLVGEAGSPDVAVAKNGDIIISYGVRDNPVNDPWDLFAQVYWDDDGEWDGPEQLNDASNPPSHFGRPAATNNGGAVIFSRDENLQMVRLTQDAENQPPRPDLTVSPMNPEVGETVTFDGRDSTDPDDEDTVEEYFFEYGDGSSSGWVTTGTVTHSYSSANTYQSRLKVKDNHGLESNWVTVSVTVMSGSTNREPTAVLTVDTNAPEKGDEVTFDGSSSFDTDGVVSQYLFNYGDGANSGWVATAKVKHAYSKEGVFTATLKVRDDEGAESSQDSVQISVVDTNEAPTASITSIEPNPAMVGDEITFVGTGSDTDGTIEAYEWKSDLDNVFGSTATVTKVLVQGTHIISFRVKDDDDTWSEEVTQEVTVKANKAFVITDLTELPDQAYTDTVIEFRVRYTDEDNDAPTVTKLVFTKGSDWKTEELREYDETDKDYTDGKIYSFRKKFGTGDWKYHFQFRNSVHPEKTTNDVEFKVEEPPGLFPGPSAVMVLGALLFIAIVTVVTSRGRKRERL